MREAHEAAASVGHVDDGGNELPAGVKLRAYCLFSCQAAGESRLTLIRFAFFKACAIS